MGPTPSARWWSRLLAGRSTRDKVHLALLAVVMVGVVAHQAALFNWFVEDTAISFAYARNLIHGEGLVPYPGAERIEGYSNPTWVAILAVMQLVGLDPFFATKYLSFGMGVATIPVVYATVRDVTGRDSDVPVVAAAFLACNAQFAIWGGAGLENGLLNLLIAVGFWRTLREVRAGSTPWSALVWLLVALTRPEGILYSAVAGFCAMVFHLHARKTVVPTLQWLALFFVPWSAYQAVHYWYFAWPLPNTYYAKLEDRDGLKFAFDKKGWNWSRNFFDELAQGYFLPIWLIGVLGDSRTRVAVATVVFFVLGASIELSHDQRWLLPVVVGTVWAGFWFGLRASEERPPRWLVGGSTALALGLLAVAEYLRSEWHMKPNLLPMPDFVKSLPAYELAGLALLLPLLGLRTRGWQLRLMSWAFCVAVVFYALYVQWDWMKGYRWYATAAVPGAIVFSFGVDGFVRLIEDMFGWAEVRPAEWRAWSANGMLVASALVLLQLPANVMHTVKVAKAPDASPRQIKVRVDFVDRLRDRLHIEDQLVDLDVDQGAHLFWSDYAMMDIAGLVDLPFAHHHFEHAFVQEYVFEERKPHYAHVHGTWASNSKIPSHPEWKRDYVEVPGYPSGRSQIHVGNFVRKDLIVESEWPYPDDERITLNDGIVVYRPVVPSEGGFGRRFYVELGLSSTRPRRITADQFRVVLFADDGEHFASWEIPPGYDWLKPDKWQPGDVFHGKFDLRLPESLPPGTYDLGVAVFGANGLPIGPSTGEDAYRGPTVLVGGEGDRAARFYPGETVFPAALTVLTVEDRAAACTADFQAALAAAAADACDEAEHDWWLARAHRAGEQDWRDSHLDAIGAALAGCWARTARWEGDGADRDQAIRRLIRAHRWDHWNPDYRSRAPALADALIAEGDTARAAADWETAYRRYADAVAVDPTRSWARRYAEEARAMRLGIDPASLAVRDAEEAAAKQAADEKRKATNAAKAAKTSKTGKNGKADPTDPVEVGEPEGEGDANGGGGEPAE
ncbi:MAG: hypothetical protein ABMB14_05580 [Myxococcota bacterium]